MEEYKVKIKFDNPLCNYHNGEHGEDLFIKDKIKYIYTDELHD